MTIEIASQEPPTAINDASTTEVNVPVIVEVLINDSDPEGDTLTVTQTTEPTQGGTVAITPTDGALATVEYT